jgi:hypothetical protein
MSRSFASRIGDLIARLLLVASRDRQAGTRDAGGREIIRLPRPDAAGLGGDELPVPADMREAADRLTEAAAAADQARGKLEATQQELDRRKDELEQLRLDAEADSRRTRRQLDDARQELETRQAELEKAAAEAEERVASARKEMEELARRQQEAAAQAGIARGLGRGPRVDMAAVPDPRRLRNPAFPRPLDNAAAVAAAGAAGRRREGGDGRGPGVGSTVAGDLLRGQAELTGDLLREPPPQSDQPGLRARGRDHPGAGGPSGGPRRTPPPDPARTRSDHRRHRLAADLERSCLR